MNKIIDFLNSLNPWLTIELTNLCNYKCSMCYKNDVDMNFRGFISEELFDKITDELNSGDLKFRGLKLAWLGEPFMHPSSEKFLKLLKERSKFYSSIAFDTNISFLNENIMKRLNILEKPVFIFLSIDAATSSTYNKIRCGGNFNQIMNNIDNILKNRRDNIFLRFQFIAMEENISEIRDFVKIVKSKVKDIKILFDEKTDLEEDYIYIRRLIDPENQEKADILFEKAKEILYFNEKSEKQLGENNNHIKNLTCEKLFTMPIIRANGDLGYCNNDPEMALKLGNLKNNTFRELWVGNKINKYRKNSVNGIFEKEKCKNCNHQICSLSSDIIGKIQKIF